VDGTDTGGAAPIAQAGHAATAIAGGLADVVVVSYAGCSYSGGGGFDSLPSTWGPWAYEAPYGFTTVATYALAAQRHMHEFGTTPEHLAAIAVQCRSNAVSNPHARFRAPLTVEDVLASPMIAAPLHRNDCCVVTDSGGAIVLVGKDRAADARTKPVWLLGFGEAVGAMRTSQMRSFTETPGTASRHGGRRAGRHRLRAALRQLHDHRAARARGPWILREGRGRPLRRKRRYRVRWIAAHQHRRRRPVVEPSGTARRVHPHRVGSATAR